MKITSMTVKKSNTSSTLQKNDHKYITNFNATITPEEKKATLYGEWSAHRIGELIEAMINQYLSWNTTKEQLSSNVVLHMAHLSVELLKHGELKIDMNFNGTRDTIKEDRISVNIKTSPIPVYPETIKPKNIEENPDSVELEREEGEYNEKIKFATYYTQHENLGNIYKSLNKHITKENQISFLQLVAFLTIQAEVSNCMNAMETTLSIDGLTNSAEDDPEITKIREHTKIDITLMNTIVEFDKTFNYASMSIN